jgi:hypothetical protein
MGGLAATGTWGMPAKANPASPLGFLAGNSVSSNSIDNTSTQAVLIRGKRRREA